MRTFFVLGSARIAALLAGCAKTPRLKSAPWPHYALEATQTWQLNSPNVERFDASGLFLAPDGELLTVSDRGASLYRSEFTPSTLAARPAKLPDRLTHEQRPPITAETSGR